MLCLSPVTIKLDGNFQRIVNCGRCLKCLEFRQSSWVLRMLLESGSHEHCSFGTLTYDDQSRPGALHYLHIQRFLKRLRKSSQTPIRFFCCGEHGKRTGREHWHLILFGYPPPYQGVQRTKLWPFGGAHFAELSTARLKYTAKYSLKSDQSIYRMSRKPGLGLVQCMRLGQWLATQSDTMPMVRSLKIEGKSYPLDRAASAALDAGYALGGGCFLKIGGERLSADLTARLYRWLPVEFHDNEIRIENVERSALEGHATAYGTF